MRQCPKCGYKEPPIWRNVYRRLYTQYCHVSELETWDQKLAEQLKRDLFVVKDGVKYLLKKDGYVQRIDAELCAHPDWRDKRISEPNKEKHKARLLPQPLNQRRLLDVKDR